MCQIPKMCHTQCSTVREYLFALGVNTGAEAHQLQRDKETQTQTRELLFKRKFLFKYWQVKQDWLGYVIQEFLITSFQLSTESYFEIYCVHCYVAWQAKKKKRDTSQPIKNDLLTRASRAWSHKPSKRFCGCCNRLREHWSWYTVQTLCTFWLRKKPSLLTKRRVIHVSTKHDTDFYGIQMTST